MAKNLKLMLFPSGLAVTAVGIVSKDFKRMFKRNAYPTVEKGYEEIHKLDKSWYIKSKTTDVCIKSYDGLNLYGSLIENNDTNKYIIFAHGHMGNIESDYALAHGFDEYGYNSLIYDQRGCGNSEGEYITFGLKESLDLIQWINFLITRKPDVSICLHGVSLGAATVMLALGTKLPDNVKCAIEDSGYGSLNDLFKYHFNKKYHLLSVSIMKVYDSLLNTKLGFRFKDVEPKKALSYNTLPICFVHATKDPVVPFDHALACYNYTKGKKKYYPIDSDQHAKGKYNGRYYKNLNDFIKENM